MNDYYHNNKGYSLLEIDLGKDYNISCIYIVPREAEKSKISRQNGTHIETFSNSGESNFLYMYPNDLRDTYVKLFGFWSLK